MTKWTLRREPAVLIAGVVGSLALALSSNGTLSAFTAQITNSTNTAATGYLGLRETLLDSTGAPTSTLCTSNDGTSASVATNSATCATINKYGGTTTALAPGGAANVTKISLTNTGTVDASAFTLTPGPCSQTALSPNGGATDVCTKIKVTMTSGAKTLFSGTAAALAAGPIDLKAALGVSAITAGQTVPVTISVSLDPTATNAYSGFQVQQSLAWSLTA